MLQAVRCMVLWLMVNAFAMGARAVNPDVKVYVEWSGIKDNDIEARFAEQGINCISDQDMITPKKTSRKFGLYVTDSGMVKHLTMLYGTGVCSTRSLYRAY